MLNREPNIKKVQAGRKPEPPAAKNMEFAPFQAIDVRQYFEQFEIQNTEQINILEIDKFMYKYENSKLPVRFEGYFQVSGTTHNHNLRSVANQNFVQIGFQNSLFPPTFTE